MAAHAPIAALSAQSAGRPDGRPRTILLQRIVAEAQKHFHKSAVGLMNENINPLWNIDERRAQQIFDFARSGNYAWLQYLYNEIEERDPTLLVCVTRRTSALAELDWRVVRSNTKLYRNADENMVKEQIQCVEEAVSKIDNLPDALEHLALSAFRGYSMIAPIHGVNGDIKHFDLIDSWNLCFDKAGQSWYFNPSGSAFSLPANIGLPNAPIPKQLQYIPPDQVCVVTRNRPIDWPALMIYLRSAVGERDWGRFLETYGLPPVIITMPEFTSKEDEDLYVAAAESVFEGRSGVVPFGSQVNYASESRGTNPFTEFIEHQMKLVVLMSTGGTLASLAESGSGTLAGDAQQDEWLRIIRADKRIVSNRLNKQVCEQILEKNFPGKPILAEFQLDSDPQPTAKEVAELASTLSSAGFEMDADELSQITGFKIRKKQEVGIGFNAQTTSSTPVSAPSSVVIPDVRAEKSVLDRSDKPTIAENAGNSASTGVSDAGKVNTPPMGETPQKAATPPVRDLPPEPSLAAAEKADAVTPQAEEIGERLVKSLQTDFKGVADEIAKVLALPEDKRAAAATELLGRIDTLIPDDPAMAEVIAEQMQEAFARQIEKQPEGDAPAANKAIPNAKGG